MKLRNWARPSQVATYYGTHFECYLFRELALLALTLAVNETLNLRSLPKGRAEKARPEGLRVDYLVS